MHYSIKEIVQMSLLLQEMTKGIAAHLISELKNGNGTDKNRQEDGHLWPWLLKEFVREVVAQLKKEEAENPLADLRVQINGRSSLEGLNKDEEKLGKLCNKTRDKKSGEDVEEDELDSLDDVDLKTIEKLEKKGVKIIYPNLKYKKPKYQNVSELLKYVESDNGNGDGVKLVIMNFND